MADRKHGAASPETTTTVTGESWESKDISGQNHTRVAFIDLDMTEASTCRVPRSTASISPIAICGAAT
jgi:fluoroquinolone resistance protein